MRNIFVIILLCLVGCSDSSSKKNEVVVNKSNKKGLAIPDNRNVDHYKILFIGNSHVAGNNLSFIVQQLFENNFSTKLATSQLAPGGGFLDERLNDGVTQEKLTSSQWTHVILQAQKVSLSQSITYSTKAAESWIELVKSAHSATPILFPEHPRKSNTTEAKYIQNIHLGIAERAPACVAPIGLAWDLALQLYPELLLHQDDGNHANITGAFLTALVIYQTISGESAENLPYISDIDVGELTQSQLAQVASQTIASHDPCSF